MTPKQNQTKTAYIRIRLTPQEKDTVKDRAKRLRISISDLIRDAILLDGPEKRIHHEHGD